MKNTRKKSEYFKNQIAGIHLLDETAQTKLVPKKITDIRLIGIMAPNCRSPSNTSVPYYHDTLRV